MILLYAAVGLLVGVFLNWAGDALPRFAHPRKEIARPQKPWLDAAVVLLTASLFSYFGRRFSPSWELVSIALTCSFFFLVALIDLKYRLVLDVLVYPAAAVTLLLHSLPSGTGLLWPLLGGAIGLSMFLLAALLRPGGLGGGDVKLAALIGLVVGFPLVLWALAVGILTGGITALILLLAPRWKLQSHIPYAPFLCAGTIVALLYDPLSTFFPC